MQWHVAGSARQAQDRPMLYRLICALVGHAWWHHPDYDYCLRCGEVPQYTLTSRERALAELSLGEQRRALR